MNAYPSSNKNFESTMSKFDKIKSSMTQNFVEKNKKKVDSIKRKVDNSQKSSKRSKFSRETGDDQIGLFSRKEGKPALAISSKNKYLKKDEYHYHQAMSARNKDHEKRVIDPDLIKNTQKQYLTQSNLEIENYNNTINTNDQTLELNQQGTLGLEETFN